MVLLVRRWCGLACCAHQIRGNIKLAGRAESPCSGESLAGQVPKCLVAQVDTVRVMGTASQCSVAAFYRQASDSYSHIEERAAVRLDQGPFLAFFPLEKEHVLRFHLPRDSKSSLAI